MIFLGQFFLHNLNLEVRIKQILKLSSIFFSIERGLLTRIYTEAEKFRKSSCLFKKDIEIIVTYSLDLKFRIGIGE